MPNSRTGSRRWPTPVPCPAIPPAAPCGTPSRKNGPTSCHSPSTRSPASSCGRSPPARRPISALTAMTIPSPTPSCADRSPSSPPTPSCGSWTAPPRSPATSAATIRASASRIRPTWPPSPARNGARTTCAAATACGRAARGPMRSSTRSPCVGTRSPRRRWPCSACSISTGPPPSTRPSRTPSPAGPSTPPPSRSCSTSARGRATRHLRSPSSCPTIPASATSASRPTVSARTTPCCTPVPIRRCPMAPLSDTLKTLGLHHTATHLDDLVALATKRRWSPVQLLEHLVATEQQERTHRSLERRLARARIGRFTPMTDFDWTWPTRIERAAVQAALRLDFLTAARNLVLVAPQGLGKTMIVQNLAHQAVLAGHRVLFLTAAQLLLDLGGQDSARALARRLQSYTQQGLLVVDEIGYLSYDARAADLLFQIVSRRYERRSLVLTTNLPFSDWPTIFPNAATVTALIDRVVHHADIISIEGDSYRRRVAESARKPPRDTPGR